MNAFTLLLLIALIVSLLYVFLLSKQIRSIRSQLEKRRLNNTRQPLSLELLNSELSLLAANINQCLELGQRAITENMYKEKELREMIASISHDLRTPLTAVKGNLQLIEQDELKPEQMQKVLIVKKHIDEMTQLVESFWEYSYFSISEDEIQLEKINLTNLIAESIADYVSQLEEKGLIVSYKQETPIFIYADRGYTNRILLNLLQNCITHSLGHIHVELECLSEKVILSIKNPISKDVGIDVARIFDRFYTADKARRKAAGLGLAVVKLLVNKMGGKAFAFLENDVLDVRIEFVLWTVKCHA